MIHICEQRANKYTRDYIHYLVIWNILSFSKTRVTHKSNFTSKNSLNIDYKDIISPVLTIPYCM